MKTRILTLIFLIGLSPVVTYAAAALWGDIDEPVEDVLQKQQMQITPAVDVPQKTTCDVLLQQAELSPGAVTSSKMQDQIKVLINTTKPEYQVLLSKPNSIKELYRQYRELYIQLNCKK